MKVSALPLSFGFDRTKERAMKTGKQKMAVTKR
jgi:hypothetical protein